MSADIEQRKDWFQQAGWGVFTHYLAREEQSAEEWDRQVAAFDVEGLAGQLAEVGAGYYTITLGQNSGHYCTPNATYDRLTGLGPSKCASRDLIADLYEALQARGLALMVYLPAGAPDRDAAAVAALGWECGIHFWWDTPGGSRDAGGRPRAEGNPRLADFQRKWEEIIGEWSLRWGTGVRGWWVDGCYYPDMYAHPDPPNWHSFAAALRAGNPESLVAFNPGVFVDLPVMSDEEDYTPGEIGDEFPECEGRWIHGVQWHVLSYLAQTWGGWPHPDGSDGRPQRLSTEWLVEYTRRTLAHGGVVTWDVPIQPSGLLDPEFLPVLRAVGEATR